MIPLDLERRLKKDDHDVEDVITTGCDHAVQPPMGRRRQFQMNLAGRIVVLLLVLTGPALVFGASPDPFDTPVDKRVVDFGPSPYYVHGTDIHVRLSCFVYRTVMVKEYDEGQKGAAWIAMVHIEQEKAPPCSKSHERGEWVLDPLKEWDGYFMGVKGDFVFLSASDGTDGGMPFAIFDPRTRKKILGDVYFYVGMWNRKFEDSPFNDLRVERTGEGQIVLRYLRVKGTLCDLHARGVSCWEPTRRGLGIRSTARPVCIAYDDIRGRWVSAVAHPVEVALFPTPVRKNVDGPVRCWPVD